MLGLTGIGRRNSLGAGRSALGVAVALLLAACPATGVNTKSPSPSTSPRAEASVGVEGFSTFAGGTAGFADGKGSAARFRTPNGLDVDTAGNVFVADTGNHRIRKIAPDGTVTTLAGGERGFKDGKAAEAQFDSPYGLAVKRDGTVYVADTKNHRIRAIATDGTVSTVAGGDGPGDRDGPPAEARFNLPFSVALDALDGIVVADTGNHRIRRMNSQKLVETLAGKAAGYKDGPTADALFNAPADVGLDARGRIYVADLKNHAVRELSPDGGRVRTVAGNGTASFADGDAASARFNLPSGVAVGASGTIYVADTQNRAVRLIAPDGRVTTIVRWAEDAKSTVAPIDVASVPAAGLVFTDITWNVVSKSR